ncbi:hypothetical protein HPP92_003379 [Vanilla planifolia]|uniref:Gnk2-homologous domain-containing protein n=1 Tax=Vanilla planifolia TaxID=51239 RepID=A0A835RXI7_VANPL|nr:hypothetical protein HPP92_003379 [Vanilla planifolia]
MAMTGQLFFLALIVPLVSCIDPLKPIAGSLDRILPDVVTRTIDGYAISSYGNFNETIYGLTNCRRDIPADACLACIAEAARILPTVCPRSADARIWYDTCFLRYGTDEFIGSVDTVNGGLILMNVLNATDPESFDKIVVELMHTVWKSALVSGNKRFAFGFKAFSPNVTIHSMVQCTRDLPAAACNHCLANAIGLFPNYCRFRQGCQVIYSSCAVRYEIYDFLFHENYTNHYAIQSYKTVLL